MTNSLFFIFFPTACTCTTPQAMRADSLCFGMVGPVAGHIDQHDKLDPGNADLRWTITRLSGRTREKKREHGCCLRPRLRLLQGSGRVCCASSRWREIRKFRATSDGRRPKHRPEHHTPNVARNVAQRFSQGIVRDETPCGWTEQTVSPIARLPYRAPPQEWAAKSGWTR
ncbi:MAG: hypothetical protein DESF_02311 [Desulfovibrio sp.]